MNKHNGYLRHIHPVLPVKDVSKAVQFYVEKLDFKLAFTDTTSVQGYAGVARDAIEIHLQWHDEKEWIGGLNGSMLRIYTDAIEAYKSKGVFHELTKLRHTPWGAKEFAFYDLYGNGLTFYRDLK